MRSAAFIHGRGLRFLRRWARASKGRKVNDFGYISQVLRVPHRTYTRPGRFEIRRLAAHSCAAEVEDRRYSERSSDRRTPNLFRILGEDPALRASDALGGQAALEKLADLRCGWREAACGGRDV